MTQEGINYCLQLQGWCSQEKMLALNELVKQTAKEFPDKTLISVDAGTFQGRSLFPMAAAHQELKKGFAVGIDAFSNPVTLEGENHPANDAYWSKMDFSMIERGFRKAMEYPEWSNEVKFLKGKVIDFASSFNDGSITLFHQDSTHNEKVITEELVAWSPKIAIGGYWVVDDSNWQECKPGYAKLPSFGFELVKDYGTWAVYRKVFQPSVIKGETRLHGFKFTNQDGSSDIIKLDEPVTLIEHISKTADTWPISDKIKVENYPLSEGGFKVEMKGTDFFAVSQPASGTKERESLSGEREIRNEELTARMIEHMTFMAQKNKFAKPLEFDQIKIMPLLLTIPDNGYWRQRGETGWIHMQKNGIEPFIIPGIHARQFGIQGRHIYLHDNVREQYYIGDGKVGGVLSTYVIWNVMAAMDNTHFMMMECDARFQDRWREKLNRALLDVPKDFDFLFVGSCDAENKEPVHIKGDVYHFPYRPDKPDYFPMGGSVMIVAKKAVPTILATYRDTRSPGDILLIEEAFKYLNVYGILPRLVEQENTELNK